MQENIGRIPPQDSVAEQSVLGAILLDSDRIIEAMEFITSDDFYQHKHRVIFRAMEVLSQTGTAIDVVTLSDELTRNNNLEDAGSLTYIVELSDIAPTAANIRYYAQIVMEKSQLRKIITAATDAANLAYEQDGDVSDIISQAEEYILKVTEKTNRSGFKKIEDVALESLAIIENNYKTNEEITGIATGFTDLDKMTAGFQGGQLIILAARPAVGKTAFALNIAQNVAKRYGTVAVFSLEMAAADLVNRMLCSEGNINAGHLKTGQLTEEEWNNLSMASNTLSHTDIYLDDTAGIKVNEIRAKCRKLHQEKGQIDLIVIDYMQLIESSSSGESRQQQVSDISRQLKKLAMELKTPVIALSQLSRAVESRDDKRPMLSDLRESGSLEQDADIVMFLYRDDYYQRDHTKQPKEENDSYAESNPDVIEIILEKNRSGARGTVKLIFKKEWNSFKNGSPEFFEKLLSDQRVE